jgi:lysophospholipase L1-like esterase
MPRPVLPVLLVALVPACGGGGGTGPTPVRTGPVTGALFYDENGNGQLDPEEARIPDATVEVAGRSARTSRPGGEFRVDGVPEGQHTLNVRGSSLPPYFVPPAQGLAVTVPQPDGRNAVIPLTLPIGENRPHVYMAFGDSITAGQGSSDDQGYRPRLQARLIAFFGRGQVVNEGVFGTRSIAGQVRIDDSLYRARPAYTLIHYGTNDYNDTQAGCRNPPYCYTIESLHNIILSVRGSRSLPVLSTIIPGNPSNPDQQPQRNEWVAAVNERIKALAQQERVPLADPHALFLREADPSGLFVDHVHPNDRGYELMAEAFFQAITTQPASSAASGFPIRLRLFARP